jgi:DNA recombination protein RmuC
MSELVIILIVVWVISIIAALVFFINKNKTDKEQSGDIRDLERRLTDLMINQIKEIRDTQSQSSKDLNEQVKSFNKETTEIREGLKQIKNKVQKVSSFEDIFKSPKLRGEWGEASLNYVMSQHFPSDLWESQYSFSSGKIVDVILKLPNDRILPIDSKFSSDNFKRMIEEEDLSLKEEYKKEFLKDTKKRIDEIASKYILPSEGTTDFAFMYIPAEAIYYKIMFDFKEDIAEYAWKQKVVLTSPNTFYLTLRTIIHWFQDTQISQQTQKILKKLSKINKDSTKLRDTFSKLGKHLQHANSAFKRSKKRLRLFSSKVDKLIEIKENKKLKK